MMIPKQAFRELYAALGSQTHISERKLVPFVPTYYDQRHGQGWIGMANFIVGIPVEAKIDLS